MPCPFLFQASNKKGHLWFDMELYKQVNRFIKKSSLSAILMAVSQVVVAQNAVQALQQLEVHASEYDELSAQQKVLSSDEMEKQATGQTLGDYLDHQPHIDSASYGPAVGRPVVRGMTGYRVKILQNDSEVSDLSAMSQDHAVGVMPKASERIELLKGPASLVYGANAGGTVRLIDQTQHEFAEEGVHGDMSGSLASNNGQKTGGVKLTATSHRYTFGVSTFYSKAEDYSDGNGHTVKDSDVLTEQTKLFAGWRYRPSGLVILSYANLHKDYGIPNQTEGETRIDMQRDNYALHVSEEGPTDHVDVLNFDLVYSDYIHDETVGSRKDGLFGQKVINASLSADYFLNDWVGKAQLGYRENELKLCHEHGACDDFTDAYRSNIDSKIGVSLANFLDTTGLPYSHGHPMPVTTSRTLMLGASGETPIQNMGDEVFLSLGAHLEMRNLQADPVNIQETWVVPSRVDSDYYQTQNLFAGSLSMGLAHTIMDVVQSEVNVSYLERLPSVDELYWNGIHHATDSYIFGNRDLTKETSINLDWDLSWQTQSMDWSASAYAYYFNNYIYQDVLYNDDGTKAADPFHLTDVWQTLQTDASFVGLSLSNDWSIMPINGTALVLSNHLEHVTAKEATGHNLPRTAPLSWELGLAYAPPSWSTKLSAKRVFKATATAENETETPAYTWVSLYADWQPDASYGQWKVWVKGDNLLDAYAQNHLSFLKQSAPLVGRQVSAGFKFNF